MKYVAQDILNNMNKGSDLGLEDINAMLGYLEERSGEAQKRIGERISEKNLAKIFNAVQSSVLMAMITSSRGIGLLAEIGDLQAYSHTLILAVLGIAMEEEWL